MLNTFFPDATGQRDQQIQLSKKTGQSREFVGLLLGGLPESQGLLSSCHIGFVVPGQPLLIVASCPHSQQRSEPFESLPPRAIPGRCRQGQGVPADLTIEAVVPLSAEFAIV